MPSPREPVYDFAIIGAGVSGLTLAWLLSEGPLRQRPVLLVDGARDDDALRTLSFWAPGPIALEPLVRHRYHTLRLLCGGEAQDAALSDYSYRTLFFADLQREAKARLLRGPGNRILPGRVQSLREDPDGVTLTVDGVELRARWAFDSRFHLPALRVDPRRFHLLRQHFHGWVVRAPRPCFEPGVATLFDFCAEAPPGTAFFYVLPRSGTEALVELVTLEPVDAEPLLRRYLARAFSLRDPELLDHEAGVSPLTEQPFPVRAGARVRRLGVAAGRLKPSTGYALTRILEDCARVVRRLEAGGDPFAPPSESRLFRLLDAVLLEVWQEEPAQIPGIFAALFRHNPADRVLRFLDERSSLWEVLRLGLSLPRGPMVRALLRCLRRRLSGGRALPPADPGRPALPGPGP